MVNKSLQLCYAGIVEKSLVNVEVQNGTSFSGGLDGCF
jgi:hypothetical protein